MTTPHLDRFVRAVHRRWVVLRALERVGLCTLLACGAGLLLVPVLLWRGSPAMPVATAMLVVGAGAGVVLGVSRRPSRLAAAAEADRQLDLADLLTTALAARADADAGQPWARAVLAVADARCGSLAPNDVVLHRLGGRAWGGIGLAAALVLTLGMMSTGPAPEARAARGAGERGTRAVRPQVPPDDRAGRATSPRPVPQPAPTAGDDGRGEQRLGSSRPNNAASANDPNGRDPNDTPSASDPAGQGGGTGRTSDSTTHRPDTRIPRPRERVARDSVTGDLTGLGGTGTATIGDRRALAGASAGSADPPGAAAAPPPWSSTSWPADRAAALEALRAGRVPPQYDSIVREYFRTDPE